MQVIANLRNAVTRWPWSSARVAMTTWHGSTPSSGTVVMVEPQLTGLVGAYESCGDPIVRPLGEHPIVDVPMEFQGGPMTGRVVFDRDGKIAGLFVLNPTTTP
jgi:hypothetical protein